MPPVENPDAVAPTAHHAMQCMEIWGTNGAADYSSGTPGVEVLVHSRPYMAAERGGDIHYVTLCASGKLTRTILADVAGHGSEVDDIAQRLRDLLRKNINTVNQKRLVRDLNNQFARQTTTAKFATAVVATVLSRKNLLTLCNAGHPRPLFYSARTKTWRLLIAEKETDGDLPLGIASEVPYGQFAIPFTPGDILILYTDGLIEACDPQGRQLGEEGLLRLVNEGGGQGGLPTDSLKATEATLSERFTAFRGISPLPPLEDDLTLLFLRHTGDVSKAYIIPRRLRSYGKLLGLLPV